MLTSSEVNTSATLFGKAKFTHGDRANQVSVVSVAVGKHVEPAVHSSNRLLVSIPGQKNIVQGSRRTTHKGIVSGDCICGGKNTPRKNQEKVSPNAELKVEGRCSQDPGHKQSTCRERKPSKNRSPSHRTTIQSVSMRHRNRGEKKTSTENQRNPRERDGTVLNKKKQKGTNTRQQRHTEEQNSGA